MPEGLRPLQGRARWAIAAIAAVMVADVAAIWSNLLEIDLMNRLQEDGEVLEGLTPDAFEDVESNDDRQLVVAAIFTVAYVAAIVFFIRWFYAAYSNLRVLGQLDIRFRPAWAIWGWFVPILNAWRPKQIANDIWRGSDPAAPCYSGAAWKELPVPPIFLAWWLAWLVSNYLSNLVLRTAFDADTIDGIETAAKLDSAASAVDLVAGVLAILVIRKLTARQEARVAARVAAGVPPDTMAPA